MSESTVVKRVRPGRDVNDTRAFLVRYVDDWRRAQSWGVSFDAGHSALELEPLAMPELAPSWLPIAPVRAPDGTWYKVDPTHHSLLARGPCDDDYRSVRGIGGKGFATGRLHSPLGLAIDGEGRLYIADAGNARVQVVAHRGDAFDVVAVLEAGLRRPVHVAIDAHGDIFVADRGTGSVHVFGAAFAPLRTLPLRTVDPWTGQPWSDTPAPLPLALAVTGQGTLLVFDPQRPWLWHMSTCGEALSAWPWPEADELPPGWTTIPRRYAAAGEAIVGPIDSGEHNFAWHEVQIDAKLPAGTTVRVQMYADNQTTAAMLAWAPRVPVAITGSDEHPSRKQSTRLILPESDGWPRWQLGRLGRVQPALFRFEGTGPSAVDRIVLPAREARYLRVGDRIALATDAGGTDAFAIVSAQDRDALVAVSGDMAALNAPTSAKLLQRKSGELPFGPLDLSFLIAPNSLALPVPTAHDGTPKPMTLPHALASFLEAGDVIELGSAAGAVRLELVEPAQDDAQFGLDAVTTGDFSTSSLTLVDSAQRLLVDGALPPSEAVPPRTTITVFDDVHTEAQPLAYVDVNAPVAGAATLWLAQGALAGHITPASWSSMQFAEPRATDHGRYLWLRLRLAGAAVRAPGEVGPAAVATSTPSIYVLRATGPRPSLLAWLPAIFSRRDPQADAPGANFLERFLTLFEGQLTRIETAYESIGTLLNPRAADAQWLSFLATWLDLAFDPSWPIERRRELVIEGAALQAARGTPSAMARYLEIYTGNPVAIAEGFKRRPPPPIQLGARGALGVAPLGGGAEADRMHDAALAHRFAVSVILPADIEHAAAASAVREIVETMKPAHTAYVLNLGRGTPARIGIDTAVDMIVIPGPERVDPCACDPDALSTPHAARGHIDRRAGGGANGFRLGGRLGRGAVAQRETR